MTKKWIAMLVVAGLPCLAACGVTDDDASLSPEIDDFGAEAFDEGSVVEGESNGEDAVLFGELEQAIGEAACGTNAVNRAVSFSGSAVRFSINAPYGSSTCANAFLTGLSSSTPRNGNVSIIGALNVPRADCARARMVSDYYVNGVRAVQQLVKTGEFRNGNCLVSTSYSFSTNRTTTTVNGNRAFMAGGTPGAAANARFSAQALNHLGQIQNFTWEINP